MNDIEGQIHQLKSEIANIQRQAAKVEYERQLARESATRIMEQLSNQFGVSGIDEARNLLQNNEEEIHKRIISIRKSLAGDV